MLWLLVGTVASLQVDFPADRLPRLQTWVKAQ